MHEATITLQIGRDPESTLTYWISQPPSALPPVRGRDLVAAWDAARAAANRAAWGAARLFRFRLPDGAVLDLALQDRDARCWADAVERTTGLQTLHGLSLCLRLLALIELLAHARWAADLCRLDRTGAELHPDLLRAAAVVELTNDARFDETRLREGLAVMPRGTGVQP